MAIEATQYKEEVIRTKAKAIVDALPEPETSGIDERAKAIVDAIPEGGYDPIEPEGKPGLGYILGETFKGAGRDIADIGKQAWESTGKDVAELLVGIPEAGMALVTGIPSYLAGLAAQTGYISYDLKKKLFDSILSGRLPKYGVELWKTGGRPTTELKDVIGNVHETYRKSENIKEAIAGGPQVYMPRTESGQMIADVAVSPFMQAMALADKGGELAGLDEKDRKWLGYLTEVALVVGLPFAKGAIGSAIRAKKNFTPHDWRMIARELDSKMPEIRRSRDFYEVNEILSKLPEETRVPLRKGRPIEAIPRPRPEVPEVPGARAMRARKEIELGQRAKKVVDEYVEPTEARPRLRPEARPEPARRAMPAHKDFIDKNITDIFKEKGIKTGDYGEIYESAIKRFDPHHVPRDLKRLRDKKEPLTAAEKRRVQELEQKLESLSPREKLEAFVMEQRRNIQKRKEAEIKTVPVKEEILADKRPSPEKIHRGRDVELTERVKTVIEETLPDARTKRIFTEKLFKEKSLTDIAKEMNVSRQRVSQIYNKHKEKFKQDTYEVLEVYSGYPFLKEVKNSVETLLKKRRERKEIKLEELKRETLKREGGSAEWMWLESARQFRERRRPSFQKAYEAAKRATVDTSGNIKRKLIENLGPLGDGAKIAFELRRGAVPKGMRDFSRVEKEIYGTAPRVKEQQANAVIMSRRLLGIEEYKPGRKRPMGVEAQDLMDFVKRADNKEANIVADRFFKAMKENTLDPLRKERLITAKEYKNLVEKGDYVKLEPLEFIDKIDPVMGRKVSVPDSGLKKLGKGTNELYRSDARALLRDAIIRTQTRIFNNRANVALHEIARKAPDNVLGIREAKIIRTTKKGAPVFQDAPKGHQKVSVVVDGKQKQIIMPDSFAKEWMSGDPLMQSQFANVMGWALGTRVLKAMATGLNPEFALTNLPRDMALVWLSTPEYSSVLPKAMGQMAKDFWAVRKDVRKRTGRVQDYYDEGGDMNFLTYQGRLVDSKASGVLRDIQNTMAWVGETSEIWTRIALRERAIRNGKSPREATHIARTYLDFNQGGNVAKAMDVAMPYYNASIQASRAIFRAATDRPAQTALKFAQVGTVSALVHLMNTMFYPDDVEKVSRHKRISSFNFFTPFTYKDKDGNTRRLYFSFAKDQGQRVVSTIFEGLMDKAMGKEIDAKEIVESIDGFLPLIDVGNITPTLNAAFGYFGNFDFWTKKKIWRGEEVSSHLEYTDYTHPGLKKAGELTGMSPERLGNALSKFFTRGNIYTTATHWGFSAIMNEQAPAEKEKMAEEIITQLPFVRRVVNTTLPYDEKKVEKIREKRIEDNDRRKLQRDEILRLSKDYYKTLEKEGRSDKKTLKELQGFIRSQPQEERSNLNRQFRDQRYLWKLPERRIWMEMRGAGPELRAHVFANEYFSAKEKRRKELGRIARELPGFWSDRFDKRFRLLIRQYQNELKKEMKD